MGEEHELKGLGKKTPFYRRGKIQPLPHCTSPHRAVLPLGQGGTTAESGTTALSRAVLPLLLSGTTAPEQYYRGYYSGSTAPDQKLVTSPVVVGTDVFFSTARKQ